MDNLPNVCRYCNFPVNGTFYFCPNCGKALRRKPESLTPGHQIYVYLKSFFLPPLGLWPAFRYLKDPTPQAHLIGYIAILLTIISLLISILSIFAVVAGFNAALNSQLNPSYSNLGF